MDHAALVAKFTTTVTAWNIEKLVTYYAGQSAVNTYGEKDEELAILMNEIKSRTV